MVIAGQHPGTYKEFLPIEHLNDLISKGHTCYFVNKGIAMEAIPLSKTSRGRPCILALVYVTTKVPARAQNPTSQTRSLSVV